MWARIVCLLIISPAFAEDAGLERLYGAQGLQRVVVCAGGGARAWREACAGALLARRWVLARRACLRAHAPPQLRVLAAGTGDQCKDIVTGLEMYMKNIVMGSYTNNARRVQSRLLHPSMDFGLIKVDRPYHYVDKPSNTTSMNLAFPQNGLWKWIHKIIQAQDAASAELQPTYKFKLNSNPFLLFFASMVLPFCLYCLLFVYVVFYTGSSAEPQYMNHQYNKEVSEE